MTGRTNIYPLISVGRAWEGRFEDARKVEKKPQRPLPPLPLPPHQSPPSPCVCVCVCWGVGWWCLDRAVVCCPLISSPLTGAHKIHNHGALCQTDNPQTQTPKYVSACVCVCCWVSLYVSCVSGVTGRIKGERRSRRKKGNGVCGGRRTSGKL